MLFLFLSSFIKSEQLLIDIPRDLFKFNINSITNTNKPNKFYNSTNYNNLNNKDQIAIKLNTLLNEIPNLNQDLKTKIYMIINEMESKNEMEITNLLNEINNGFNGIIEKEANSLIGTLRSQIEGINKILTGSLSKILNDALTNKVQTEQAAQTQNGVQKNYNGENYGNIQKNMSNIVPNLQSANQISQKGVMKSNNQGSKSTVNSEEETKLNQELQNTIEKVSTLETNSIGDVIDALNLTVKSEIIENLTTLKQKIMNIISQNSILALEKIVNEVNKQYS
ncbi:hypothetical protein DMUE_4922 [Dictyocoela muelleri]|nr:hypothetical protein DMUE_4922 [Dictyocoela muelleri]